MTSKLINSFSYTEYVLKPAVQIIVTSADYSDGAMAKQQLLKEKNYHIKFQLVTQER